MTAVLDLAELEAIADRLQSDADRFKESIVCGTRTDWQCWDLLDKAARYLWSAAVGLQQQADGAVGRARETPADFAIRAVRAAIAANDACRRELP